MTLYEYLKNCEDGTEVTVTDKEYGINDIETYFYADFNDTDNYILELSKLVEIEVLEENCVACNFSEIIEKHIEELNRELFNNTDIDDIMYQFDYIISGYVSENWMKNFVEILKK